MKKIKKNGFTLIEVLIVVAIISLLMAIALPSYERYVQRARRSDAISMLHTLAAREEQYYFQNHNSYTDDAGEFGGTAGTNTLTSPDGYYTITLSFTTAGDNQTYTLTAAPVATKSQAKDSDCQSFSLTNTGVKAATTSKCWSN